MQIRAEEISEIIKTQIKDYDKKVEISETGTVLSVGDGVAKVYGVEKSHGHGALGVPPTESLAWSSTWKKTMSVWLFWAMWCTSRKATWSNGPAGSLRSRSATPFWAAWSTPSVRPLDGKGPVESDETRRIEVVAPRRYRPPAGYRTDVHRSEGH